MRGAAATTTANAMADQENWGGGEILGLWEETRHLGG
jgi:hypothetical protein